MNLRKRSQSLVVITLVDMPSRRLRNYPDENKLEDGWRSLYHGRDAPRPVVWDVITAEGKPCSDNAPKIPSSVVDGRVRSAVLRVDQLSDQQRRGAMSNGNTKSDEEAGGDKHAKVDTGGLKSNSEDHDNATNENGHPTAKHVGRVRDNRQCNQATQEHYGTEEANDGALGIVEI